jgi:ubiquinone/menaquinone biosynthesis C-methylase UbiE
MNIDQDRVRAILKGEHSYYGRGDIPIRHDSRWHSDWQHMIAPQLSPAMRVLDVGCGKGTFLCAYQENFDEYRKYGNAREDGRVL